MRQRNDTLAERKNLADNYFSALIFVLKYEGGLVDHAKDPGGRTYKGITQKKLDEIRVADPALGLPKIVDALTDEQVSTIYHREYWMRLACNELPPGVALALFDTGVNCGIGRAAKWLQQALGVTADGIIGAQTIAAAKGAVPSVLLDELLARRAFHYMTLDSIDDVFGLGWARRLMACHTAALAAA